MTQGNRKPGRMPGIGEEGPTVQPIDAAACAEVVEATHGWIRRASGIYGCAFESLPVLFDLKGRMAGMYRVMRGERVVRFNPWIFAKYPEDSMGVTVPHEVAHYVTDMLHGFENIRPHGPEWQEVMRHFGVDPDEAVIHRLDLTGIPIRRQRRHPYRCNCRTHQLSGVRHGRIVRKSARYFCRRCGADLVHVSAGGKT